MGNNAFAAAFILLQASQSSLNNAALALVMQAVATGLLVTANVANQDYSSALADVIQVMLWSL